MAHRIFSIIAIIGVVFGVVGTAFSAVKFQPGVTIYDTDGNVLNAHGFDIQKFNGVWYWYGNAPRVPGCAFGCYGGINCYSSPDLKNWHFEGMVQQPSGTGYLGTNSVAYDPHVLYNSVTNKYVMVLSECCPGGGVSDFTSSHLCFATSSTPNGTFAYQGSCRGVNNSGTMDMMAFKDDDGSGYVIYSADNNGVAIDKLGSDYLSVASRTAYFGGGNCEEAPCLFKANGRYYLYDSYCAGWSPNQGHYRTATNLAGPWSSLANCGDGTTYNSQGTVILSIMGTVDTTYVYVADRWNCSSSDCNYYRNSTYVFLPLIVNGASMTLNYYDTWYLNVAAGTWFLADDSTTVALPAFTPAAGRYTSAQSVSISCATAGATVRYTTNGADPTSSSPAYAGAISVTQTTTIKAQASKTGMTSSDIATAVYQIVAPGSDWTIFTNQTPVDANVVEAQGLELGVKFTSTAAGKISAVRYYKSTSETGSHIGRIWSATGTQLASATFANETSTGWQEALLSSPLTISASTVYIVSVNYNTAYVASNNGLASAIVNGPLSTVVGSNGVYGTAGTFPTQTYQNSNYFRDVLFIESSATAVRRAVMAAPFCGAGSALYDIHGRRIGRDNGASVRYRGILVAAPAEQGRIACRLFQH